MLLGRLDAILLGKMLLDNETNRTKKQINK